MHGRIFDDLRAELKDLAAHSGLRALKTGTEVEDMGFEDIRTLKALSADIVPLFVKMGGPEARNDMRELHRIGVDGLIAPMIESAYALKKFIQTFEEIGVPTDRKVETGINLETIDGFSNMNAILSIPEARRLDQVTAARTDLSGSMNLDPDDERVLEICSVIVARCREHELRTSVGGAIHPAIAARLIREVEPDTINTRHMVIARTALNHEPEAVVRRNLNFEVRLYEFLSRIPSIRSDTFGERARILRGRLESRKTARSGL